MSQVRVAVVGVGNCAASLVQGVHYYADADPSTQVPGLMHVDFGGYHVRDVTFVAAFDVDAKKVGQDLADAISASENNTVKIADVPPLGVTVQRGPTLDGLGRFYRETITEADGEPADVVQVLRDTGADVLVSYLPVGGEDADRNAAVAGLVAYDLDARALRWRRALPFSGLVNAVSAPEVAAYCSWRACSRAGTNESDALAHGPKAEMWLGTPSQVEL